MSSKSCLERNNKEQYNKSCQANRQMQTTTLSVFLHKRFIFLSRATIQDATHASLHTLTLPRPTRKSLLIPIRTPRVIKIPAPIRSTKSLHTKTCHLPIVKRGDPPPRHIRTCAIGIKIRDAGSIIIGASVDSDGTERWSERGWGPGVALGVDLHFDGLDGGSGRYVIGAGEGCDPSAG